MTPNRLRFDRWIVIGSLVVGIFVSVAKTIRVFLLNPRELGTPRGAAEDWFVLVAVLSAMTWASLRNGSVATIGRAGIVTLSIGVAILFLQDFVESFVGIGSQYADTGSAAVERQGAANIALSAIFFAAGSGIYRWANWGRKLTLAVSFVVLVGTVALTFNEGISVKYVSAFAVMLSIILWLFQPAVRRCFAPGAVNE